MQKSMEPTFGRTLTGEQAAIMIDKGREVEGLEWCFSYYPKEKDYKKMKDAARTELADILRIPADALRDFDPTIQISLPVRLNYDSRSGEEIVKLGFESVDALFWNLIGRERIGYELFKIIKRNGHYRAYLCAHKEILEDYGQFVSPKKDSREHFSEEVRILQSRLRSLLESIVSTS